MFGTVRLSVNLFEHASEQQQLLFVLHGLSLGSVSVPVLISIATLSLFCLVANARSQVRFYLSKGERKVAR